MASCLEFLNEFTSHLAVKNETFRWPSSVRIQQHVHCHLAASMEFRIENKKMIFKKEVGGLNLLGLDQKSVKREKETKQKKKNKKQKTPQLNSLKD